MSMRLPRARSSPLSRHWLLDSSAAASETRQLGRDWTAGFRDGSRCNRPYHAGRQRAKADLQQALNTRDEKAQLRRLQQVGQTHQFHKDLSKDLKSAEARAAELSRRSTGNEPPMSQTAAQALHGIESSPPFEESEPKALMGPPPGARQVPRRWSLKSEEAMHQLAQLDESLSRIEQQVAEIDGLSRLPSGQGRNQMRTDLALLEAEANKLESKGVDSVYTSELVSGRDDAKNSKKALLRRLEALFVQIESIFRGPLSAEAVAKHAGGTGGDP